MAQLKDLIVNGVGRFIGKIYASEFIGKLTGNADTATSATKATQDESGNNIKASYASSIGISDHTITLKNKNGESLGTVTVPDNNTWRGIQDNLTSDSTTDSLSAAQGKALKSLIDHHRHKYAGSSSIGGSANSAVRLDSSAGSATQPVYFSDGKPVACNFTYEERTWEPTLPPGATVPFKFQNGKYIKVGNIVTLTAEAVAFDLSVSNVSSQVALFVESFPFVPKVITSASFVQKGVNVYRDSGFSVGSYGKIIQSNSVFTFDYEGLDSTKVYVSVTYIIYS